MIIIAGAIHLKTGQRERFIALSSAAIVAARAAEGCLDFAVAADPVDESRVNIFERWESEAALERFRGEGMDEDHSSMIASAKVGRYQVTDAGPP